MAIEKYINDTYDMVFDPIPSYPGIWTFKAENLAKNAIKQDGKNLFQEYYAKYYAELNKTFKYLSILENGFISSSNYFLEFLSNNNNNRIGRNLNFNKVKFFMALEGLLNDEIDRHGKTNEEHRMMIRNLAEHLDDNYEALNSFYSEAMRHKKEIIKDILDNQIQSSYYDVALKDYEQHNLSVDFSQYIKKLYDIIDDFQTGLLKLEDYFDRNLDVSELYKCFDPDRFYLLFGVIIYEHNLESEKRNKKLANNFNYLREYFLKVQEVYKEDKRYNPTVLYEWKDGKKERISQRELERRYLEMKQRHPEEKEVILPTVDNSDYYKNIDLIEKIEKIYDDDIKVNWEFLPAGEGIKKSDNRESSVQRDKKVISVNDVNLRIEIMEHSGFIGKPIKGKSSFSNYYAFIYPNGKVILEKFWENENELIPSVNNATYVMTIDHFMEMSKMAKIDLIEYMKKFPDMGMKRIFHTSIDNWQKNLYKEINGSYRIDDAISFINSLRSESLDD